MPIIDDVILFEETGQLNYSIGEEDESVQFKFKSCPNQHSWGRSQDHLLLTPAAVQKVFIWAGNLPQLPAHQFFFLMTERVVDLPAVFQNSFF